MFTAATLTAILAVIDEVIALLPTLIAAGANVANLVTKIDAVWKQAAVAANDPQFAELVSKIDASRATLQARAAELHKG